MSKSHVASMSECFAKRDGMNLVNVKFFRGDRDLLSADELRAEVKRAASARTSGDSKAQGEAPRSAVKKVNVREWVAAL